MVQVIDSLDDDESIIVVRRTLAFAKEFYHPIALGWPLTPELRHLIPPKIYLEEFSKDALPDVFEVSGVWVVGAVVQTIINSLEPGVHTFMNVATIESEAGVRWHGYSILYVGQAVDAVLIDQTSFRDGDGRAGFSIAPVLNSLRGKTVLDRNKVQGRHLWRGGRALQGRGADPFYGYLFCSDELASALKSAGVGGWQFRQCHLSA